MSLYSNGHRPVTCWPIPNIMQHGDALKLLRSLPDACTPMVFFDPQHRGVLDHLQYGNEESRQRRRAKLPAMTSNYIDACCREAVRVLKPSGYLLRWIDTLPSLRSGPSAYRRCLPMCRSDCVGQSATGQRLSITTQGRLSAGAAEAAACCEKHMA